MKYLNKALPLCLAAIFAAPLCAPVSNNIGLFTSAPVFAATKTQAAVNPIITHQKLNLGDITVYDYGRIKIHAYKTSDVLSDESYVLESKDGLVLLESSAFKKNIQEFNNYIHSLKKPLKGQLLSYHSNGYDTYDKAPVYATKKALASWGEHGNVRNLTNSFVSAFGDTGDTHLPSNVKIIKDGDILTIAGMQFKILSTLDDDYSVEIPEINVVYRHMMGSKVHNILPSITYVNAEIKAMENYQKKDYGLILTSHYAPEGQSAVAEKLVYLKKIKELATVSKTKAEFIAAVKTNFPDYEGDNYLQITAAALYQK